MSAQPPITYLGTRSHQRRGKRSCHVKSYRALISTAIRRRFGGSECWDTVGESQNDRVFPSSTNNNKCHSTRTRVKSNILNSDNKFKRKPELKKQAKNAIPLISGKSPKTKSEDINNGVQESLDAASKEMLSKDAQEKQEDLSDSRVPHTSSTQGLPSPGSSTSETSDYQRSTPSPNNEADIPTDLNNEWAQLKADPTLGDEGFSETIGCQDPDPRFQNLQPIIENENDLRDEILSNSLDSCDVFISNFEDLDDELGPLHIDEDEPPKSSGTKRQADCTSSDEIEAKKMKHENKSFPPFFNNVTPLKKANFQGNVSKSSSSDCHREVNLEENKHSKSEKSSLFSLERLDSVISGKNKIKTETEPIVDLKNHCHSSNEPNSAPESQSRPVFSIIETKLEPTTDTNDKAEAVTKIHKDDNVFEVPLPPGQYHSTCKWINCSEKFSSSETLFDHIKMVHVVPSGPIDDFARYKCYWKACKLYGKGSSSKSWLEKHLANHCGRKPFACIFEGCCFRFSTQSLMQRHVNQHFKPSTSSSQSNGSSSSSLGVNEPKPGPSHPVQKTNRKFLQVCHTPVRRQYFLPRMFDCIDEKTFIKLENHVSKIEDHRRRLHVSGILPNNDNIVNILDQTVVFSSTVKAYRRTADGRDDVLLAWEPSNLIADEWVPRSNQNQKKCVKVHSLPSAEREKTIAFILNELSSKARSKRPRKKAPPRRPQPPLKYSDNFVLTLSESREPLKS